MPRCPSCAQELDPGEPSACRACGWRQSASKKADKPAHLSVLEPKPSGNGPAAGKIDDVKAASLQKVHARGRLVSTAGPALPVRKQETDSVPSSWLARLDAARMLTNVQQSASPLPKPPPLKAAPRAPSHTPSLVDPTSQPHGPVSGPVGMSAAASPSVTVGSPGGTLEAKPAFEEGERADHPGSQPHHPGSQDGAPQEGGGQGPGATPPSGGAQIQAKPAHVLVAELEAMEKERSARSMARLQQLIEPAENDDIAGVEIKLEEPVRRKRWLPDWLIVAVLAVAVLGGLYGVYVAIQEEPPPVVEIDPRLEEARATRARAMAELQRGHELALAGADRAGDAIQAYQRALELEPTLASAERGLAIAYTAKDDKAQAVLHYERYLALDPAAPDAAAVRAIIDDYRRAHGEKASAPKEAGEAESPRPARSRRPRSSR